MAVIGLAHSTRGRQIEVRFYLWANARSLPSSSDSGLNVNTREERSWLPYCRVPKSFPFRLSHADGLA